MINILYVVSTLQKAGPISFLYNLIEELDRSKVKPIILTLSNEKVKLPSFRKNFVGLDIKIIDLHLTRLAGFFYAKDKIKEVVSKNNIHIIHTVGYRPDQIIRDNTFKDQILISSIQSNIFDDYPMLYGKYKGTILAKSHIRSLHNKTVVSCSRFVRDSLEAIANCKSEIIYNSVSKNNSCLTTDQDKLEARLDLGIHQDSKIFVFTGSLILRKDPLTAIKGFKNADIPNSTLVILGEGPLLNDCIKEVGERKNIIFKGYVNNVQEYLKSADFYIASSLSEGLPFSVLEAFSFGLPSILSDIKPHNELITMLDDDNDKLMFETENYLQLSKIILNFYAKDYLKLQTSFRKVIEDKVNSGIMAAQFLSLYQSQNKA